MCLTQPNRQPNRRHSPSRAAAAASDGPRGLVSGLALALADDAGGCSCWYIPLDGSDGRRRQLAPGTQKGLWEGERSWPRGSL
jgi:hypothetical protein